MTQTEKWERCPGILCHVNRECVEGKRSMPCLYSAELPPKAEALRHPIPAWSETLHNYASVPFVGPVDDPDPHLALSDALALEMPFPELRRVDGFYLYVFNRALEVVAMFIDDDTRRKWADFFYFIGQTALVLLISIAALAVGTAVALLTTPF